MKNVYIVEIDSTKHYIKADSKESAEEQALEWFSERKPSIKTHIDNDVKPDVEI